MIKKTKFIERLDQFSVFRILLGGYLFYHFFSFFNDQEHVFSTLGPIQKNYQFLPFVWFPNIIDYVFEDTYLKAFFLLMCFFSIFLIFGFLRIWFCIGLWYGWACFFNFNTLVINPASSVVGWLILFTAMVPAGEPLSFSNYKNHNWKLSPIAVSCVWIFIGYTMSVSGVQKLLTSETWLEGSTLYRIIHDYPLTRVYFFTDWLKTIPQNLLKILTWIFLLVEILFLPSIFFKSTRIIIWFCSAFMLSSSLLIIDFSPIPLGILLCHVLIFDKSWIPSLKPRKFKFMS